jgi:hypothetical protein
MLPSRYPAGIIDANKGIWSSRLSIYETTRSCFVYRDIVIPLNFADGTGTNTTTFTIPANSFVMPNPSVYIRTAESTGGTKTFKVGITGTAGAFINGLSSATGGMVQPTLTFGSVTLGTSLFVYGGTGSTAPVPQPYLAGTAIAVTWTPGSTDWAQFDADLIISIAQFVDLTNLPVNTNINNIDFGAGS